MSPIGVSRGASEIVIKKMAWSMIYENIHLKLGPRTLLIAKRPRGRQIPARV